MEQKYNEILKPVYDNRTEVIKSIPDFWITAVSKSNILLATWFKSLLLIIIVDFPHSLQFLSHPALGELLTEEDQKV